MKDAEYLIDLFRSSFTTLYGQENQSYTFHCITRHLVKDAKKHGSLVSHSLFSLEGCIGLFNITLNGTVNLSHAYIKSQFLKHLFYLKVSYIWYILHDYRHIVI